jgi:hypothetical protein
VVSPPPGADLRAEVFIGPFLEFERGRGTFAATTSTLICGSSVMFGDRVAKPTVVPEPLDGLTLDLEGHELQIVEVGQGDIRPSTVVHIPALEAVVAGDVVYNQIHAMLGLSGPFIAEVEAADGARALVLRGAGKVFSAGADVALFAGMSARPPTRCCSAVRTDTELGLARRWEVDDD